MSIREGPEELTLRRIDGVHLWLMLIGMSSARRSTKVLKVETGSNCNEHYTEMSRAAGVRKPKETQKPKTVWNMKKSNATGTVGRAPQRPDCGTGYSVDVHGEFVPGLIFGPRLCGGTGLQWLAQASSKVCGIRPIWEGVWPYLDPWVSVCLRTASVEWIVPRKYGPHGELFFLPGPFFNADIRTSLFLC